MRKRLYRYSWQLELWTCYVPHLDSFVAFFEHAHLEAFERANGLMVH